MSQLTKELRVIPDGVDICVSTYACVAVCVFSSWRQRIRSWPNCRAGDKHCPFPIMLVLVAWVVLIGYIYGDAKQQQVMHVDATGDLRSPCDRDDLVFHSPRPSAKALPRLRACRKGKIPILSALRYFDAANVPEM